MLNSCFDQHKALQDDQSYEANALIFANDYDRENPLTTKQGHMRLLELQIKKAKNDGNDEVVKQLEGKQTDVQNQDFFQQINNYA